VNNISKTWTQKFDLIEKSGGEKLKNMKIYPPEKE